LPLYLFLSGVAERWRDYLNLSELGVRAHSVNRPVVLMTKCVLTPMTNDQQC
jgi:hypothetical protein